MHSLYKLLLFHFLSCFGLHTLGSQIINGTTVPENLMVYMASVQNIEEKHVCGGFLISEDFVVTAAHCINAKPTSVVVGTHNLKKMGNYAMRYSVKTCKHPSYIDVRTGDDIMLLKLSKKARLNKRVQPIQLPKNEIKLEDNKKCSVAGWGFTKTGGEAVDVLKRADVPIVNLDVCKKEWCSICFNLPANIICAGGYGTKKGFCRGDSGGPLVCDKKAVGVVSFNMKENCDYPNAPNVYTNISKYLPWIRKTLKQGHC
ncbi:granzyme B-like [Plectropomus leopardus]|uniref:granzyme B-like n=1 Tax=Plectropomus leopardus TaxID=160734 RepID=UPI001C4D4F36|nr:granzyme B-like [Plectropomus leopardus]